MNGKALAVDATCLDGVVATFADANIREASPLERQLPAALIDEVDPLARAAGGTGVLWVAAAIVEAVESGSLYVAPRRIREICRRRSSEAGRGPAIQPPIGAARAEALPARGGRLGRTPPRRPRAPFSSAGDQPPAIAPASADGGLERETSPASDGDEASTSWTSSTVPTFLVDPALGLNNRQLSAAVLDELRRSVPAGAFATWLKSTRLIGLAEPNGALVVGVPNSFRREWLGERFAAQTEAAVEVVLGRRRGVRFEVERAWLAGAADPR